MGLFDRLTFIARAEKTAYEKNQAAKHGLTPEHVPFVCTAEYSLPVRYEFEGLLDAAFSEKVATSIGVQIMKAVMFPERDSQGNEITAMLMEFVSTTEDELQYAVKELFEYNRMGAA